MLVEQMIRLEKEQGNAVVTKGDKGDACYIILSGICSVQNESSQIAQLSAGYTFGELAMLYDVPRTATILCTSPRVLLCMLRGPAVRRCLAHFKERCLNQTMGFLNNHAIFSKLMIDEKRMLANALSPQTFELGALLIDENISSSADWIFLLQEGTVEVTDHYKNRKVLGEGATISGQRMPYGHKAVVARALSRVRCLAMGKSVMNRIFGNIEEVLRRSTVRSFLESVAVFRELTDKQQMVVAALFQEQQFKKGEVIVTALSDPQLVVVMDGEVGVVDGVDPQAWRSSPTSAARGGATGPGSPRSTAFDGVLCGGRGFAQTPGSEPEVELPHSVSWQKEQAAASLALLGEAPQTLRRGEVFGERTFREHCSMDRSLVANTDAVVYRAGHDEVCRALRGSAEKTPPLSWIVERNRIKAHLQAVFPFSALYEAILDVVVESMGTAEYQFNDVIVEKGVPASRFCLVVEGEAVKRRGGELIESLGRWSHFGARQLVLAPLADVEVVAAATGCTVKCLEHEQFVEICGVLFSELATKMKYQDFKVGPKDIIKYGPLGQGQFGTVDRVYVRGIFGEDFALKYISKRLVLELEQQGPVRLEREILTECCHPLIVRLIATFQDEHSVYFLMENLTGGDLFTAIRDIGMLNEEQTLFFGASIVLAIEYLHSRGVMYRDLKPENVMLQGNGYLKLVDMGCCSRKARSYTFVGTPEYIAPEVILGKGYDKAIDWWSVGVIMHEMICGPLPFGEGSGDLDPLEVMREVLEKPLAIPKKVAPEASDLLTSLLERSPEQRLGSSTFHWRNEVREHQFFDLLQWDAILEQSTLPPYVPEAPDHSDAGSEVERCDSAPLDSRAASRRGSTRSMRGSLRGSLRLSKDDLLNTSHSFDPLSPTARKQQDEAQAGSSAIYGEDTPLPPDPGADLSCFEGF